MSAPAVLTVTGTAASRGPSPDGVLTVKVVSPDGEVLAATAVAAVAETPTAFEASVDAALAPEPEKLRLWAMLRTDEGVWGTPELVTVRDEVMLSRVDEG